ncbi:MAG TPA: hypothetical protein VM511_06275 [Luteolibacter sp.]|nr:hypothetical protein [Luteolibacter sp.]
MMKTRILITTFALIKTVCAGEASLTQTYQPLDGLGAGEIKIVAVTCHHWFSNSATSAVNLIAAANVPPTDNPAEAKEDLNLASTFGLKFTTSDLGDPDVALELKMDVSRFVAPENSYPPEDVIRASLECVRRAAPEKLSKTPVILIGAKPEHQWIEAIVREFNAHNRKKVFYTPEP